MKQNTIELLRKNRTAITENWIKVLMQDDSMREDITTNEDLRVQVDELVTALVNAFQKGNFDNIEAREYEEVMEIVTGLSLSRAKQGYSPRETGMFIMSLKAAFKSFLLESKADDMTTVLHDLMEISQLIDNLSIVTFDTYIKGREEVILRQTNEIEEISSPVIRVWDGIVALPIIGTLDSARTQVVMENLLNEIVNTGSSIAILDISGVPAVDSLVAQHLIKTVSATRLMGAECIISGIKPEIAQTIVHLGIDLSDIYTKATLANALRFAFQKLKLHVVSTEKKVNG
ncbi:MAG: STAS domain-containing protein [Bacteroidota bacterium]